MRHWKYRIIGSTVVVAAMAATTASVNASSASIRVSHASAGSLNVEIPGGAGQSLPIPAWLPRFEKQTGIHVNLITVPQSSLPQKLLLDLKTNAKQYDLVMIPEDLFTEFASSGYLSSLGSTRKTPNWLQGFIPSFASRVQYRGKWFGAPVDAESNALYYNTKLFKEAGLNPNNPPSTWSQFLADSLQLKKHGIYATGWLGASGNNATWNWADFLFSYRGTFFNSKNKVVFDAPAGVSSLTYIDNLINKYHVMPASVTSWGYNQLDSAMTQGQVAMEVTWNSLLGEVNDPTQSTVVGQVKIAPPPGANGIGGVPGGEWKWVIPSDSTNRSAALSFMKFFTSTAYEAYQARKYSLLPPRTAVYAQLEKSDPSYTWNVWKTIFAKDTQWMPVQQPNWTTISNDISYAIQKTELGQSSPAQALRAAASQVQPLLKN